MPKMYKVCAVDDEGNFRSSNWIMKGRDTPKEVLLYYQLGQATEAPLGGCLVFRTQDSAEFFKKCNFAEGNTFVILKGSVKEKVKLPTFRVYPESSWEMFKAAWNETGGCERWPENTECYKYFTPEEIVIDGR